MTTYLIIEPFNRAGMTGQLIVTTKRDAVARAAYARGAYVSVAGVGPDFTPLVPASQESLDISREDCNIVILTDAQMSIVQDALAALATEDAEAVALYLDLALNPEATQ